MLLELLSDALLEENTLPKSFYDTKKIISRLGLSYEKIHVCPNECILYRKDLADAEIFPKCNLSRSKCNSNDVEYRKRYQQRFFVGSLLYLDCKEFLYHQNCLFYDMA